MNKRSATAPQHCLVSPSGRDVAAGDREGSPGEMSPKATERVHRQRGLSRFSVNVLKHLDRKLLISYTLDKIRKLIGADRKVRVHRQALGTGAAFFCGLLKG